MRCQGAASSQAADPLVLLSVETRPATSHSDPNAARDTARTAPSPCNARERSAATSAAVGSEREVAGRVSTDSQADGSAARLDAAPRQRIPRAAGASHGYGAGATPQGERCRQPEPERPDAGRDEGGSIALKPVNPELAYVPYYDPQTVYGPWRWPAYPPVYWPAWQGYIGRPGLPFGSAWGDRVAISAGFFFGAFDWHRRHVNVVHVNNFYCRPGRVNAAPGPWQQDVDHAGACLTAARRCAAFGRPFAPAAPDPRSEFRGHQAPFAVAPLASGCAGCRRA